MEHFNGTVRSRFAFHLDRLSLLAACLAVAFGLLVAPAVAADISWNVDSNGNWNATGSWLGGVIPGSTTATDSTDVATFGFTLTAAPTVTVDTNRNIGGIIFSNTSAYRYLLANGNLLLSNGGLIQTAAGNGNHTDTIASAIAIQGIGGSGTFAANATSGSSLLSITGGITGVSTAGSTTTLVLAGGNTGANTISGVIGDGAAGGKLAVTKTGGGLWVLSGANTFTGTTSINAGTLELRQGGSLVGPIAIGSGATLGIRSETGGTMNVAAAISGSGGIVKNNYGSVRLSNASNTFSGGVTVNKGQVVVESPAALGSGPVAVTRNGATSALDSGGQLSLVSQTGMVVANSLTLSSNNALPMPSGVTFTFPQTTGYMRGAVVSAGNNEISGNVTFTGSNYTSVNSVFGTLTLSGSVSVASDGTTVLTASEPIRITGRLTGGTLSKFQGGTVVLTNTANSLSGITIFSNMSSSEPRSGRVLVENGLALGGDVSWYPSSTGVDPSVAILPGFLEVRAKAADAATTFQTRGILLNRPDTANTNAGLGIFVDTNPGGTDINGTVAFGKLEAQNGFLGTYANGGSVFMLNGRNGYGISFGTGGQIPIQGGSGNGFQVTNYLNGNLVFNGDLVDTSGRTLTFAPAGFGSGQAQVNGNLLSTSSGAALTKNGVALLVLAGSTSTFTGATTINAGGIRVTTMAALPQGQLNLAGGSLLYNGTGETSSKTISLSGAANAHGYLWANQSGAAATPLVLQGSITAATGAKTLYLGGSSTLANEIRAAIPNAAATALSVWKNDVGTWVLSGTNTFTGSTTVSSGELRVQGGATNADMLPNAGAITFASDPFTNGAAGTFAYRGASNTANSETVGALTPSAGAGRILASSSGTGSAVLTFASLGSRTAGATVDFATANSGTIKFTTGPAGTNGIVSGWATFGGVDWVTPGTTASGYTGYTTLDASSNSSTTNYQLTTGAVSLAGAASVNSLKVAGSAGTTAITLGGRLTNTTGGVLFDNSLGSASITGSNLGADASEVIIITGGTGASSNVLTVNSLVGGGAGTLTKSGSGTVVLTAANAYTGNTTINEGTVRLSGATATLGAPATASRTTIRQGGTLDINAAGGSATITVGALDGSGVVTNSGGASGTTAGTLQFGGWNTVSGTGVFTGVLQDGGGKLGFLKQGTLASRQFLTAANTYTGPTTILWGTLSVTNLANIGQASGIGRGDATSDATNAASLVFSGAANAGATLQYIDSGLGDTRWVQTPSVTTNRLFTLASTGEAQIDSSASNNAALIFSNTSSIRFSGAGTRKLVLQGSSTGDNRIDMQLVDNGASALTVVKSGTGVWWLNNTSNTYSGNTALQNGVLIVGDDSSAATRTLSPNGVLDFWGGSSTVGILQSTGTFTRAVGPASGNVSLAGQTNGFAAGAGDLLVNLGNGAAVTWGSTNFNPSVALAFGSNISQGVVTFANPINIGNNVSRTIRVNDNPDSNLDYAVMSGAISGTGLLTKSGVGLLRLSGQNTLSGTIQASAGALVVGSFGGSATSASSLGGPSTVLNLNGGEVRYIGSGETSDRRVTGVGAITSSGAGPLVLTSYSGTGGSLSLGGTYLGANMFSGSSSAAMTITVGSTWILTGSNTLPVNSLIYTNPGAAVGIGDNSAAGQATFKDNAKFSTPTLFAYGGDRTIANNVVFDVASGDFNPASSFGFFGDYSLTMTGSYVMKPTSNGGSGWGLSNNVAAGKLLTLSGPFAVETGAGAPNGTFAGARRVTVTGSGDTLISGPMSNVYGSGTAFTLFQQGTGVLTISSTGNASSNWNVTADSGVVVFTNTNAYWSSATLTPNAAGAIAAGFAIDQTFLARIPGGSAGVIALAADSANNLNFSSSSQTAASLGAARGGTYVYSGVLTPSGTAYRLGGGGGTLDFRGALSGTNTLTIGGDASGLGGTVILSGTANSFTGKTTVTNGVLEFASLGNVNGGNSTLGNPSNAAAGQIDIGSGTSAVTLRYVGSGNSSDRVINLAGQTGGATIDASGSGALVFSSAFTASGTGNKTFTLTGSSAFNNSIVSVANGSAGTVSVDKTGSGLWRMTGASSYTGRLRVLDGTLVVASNVGDSNSPFGAGLTEGVLPVLGDSSESVSGTAALLVDGVSVQRGFFVAASGSNSSQVAVIGATGSGTATIGTNTTKIRLGRDVTLQASDNATAVFRSEWTDSTGTASPARAFTIGSTGNAGTVVLESFLPSTATGLSIVNGTARLATPLPSGGNYWEPVGWQTPLTLGAASGAAALDLNGQSQSFKSVTFSNNTGIVSGSGTLWFYNDPGLTAQVTVSSGTGHVISSNAGLDVATTFNVNAASRLRISGGIGVGYDGAQTLTKSGAGILQLTGVNTYTGTTAVTAGRLLVDGSGDLSNTARVVVNGAGAELKWNSSAPLTSPLSLTQGTISGTGTISATGGVTVGTNAILSPGNSPGIQSYTTGLTWAAGGSYLWEINDWTGGAGAAYDQLAVSGSPLDITATSGSTFNILITSLTGSNTAGIVPNFNDGANRTFTLATSSAGITGFNASKFYLDTSAFSNTYSGSFSITSTGTSLLLNYLSATPAFTSTDYTLTAAAGTANIRVGGTTSITATVTNTGTGTADSLAVSGLAVTVSPAGTVTLSPTSGTAAIDNGTVAGSGVFTGTAAGAYSFTPSVSSATNVNLATSATLTSTGSTTVSVYNVAAPNSITGTITLGPIITGGTFGTQALTISNTAAAGSYSEKLDAVFGAPTGDLTASGSISLLVAGGTSTNMLVGLTSGTSVGVASGSVVVDFTSNGDGTSGLGTLSAGSQTVWVEGTVLAHSQASLLSTLLTSSTINLGTWDYQANTWLDGGNGSAAFSIFNLASTSPELTAALDITGTSMTGDSGFSTDFVLSSYSLIAGGTSASYTASFDPTGFTTQGTYTAIFTFLTSDQQNLSGAMPGNTLTVTASVIVVPEPQAIALAVIGIAAVAYAARRRRSLPL